MPSYLITGASRGLGYAYLQHLAAIPDNVVIGLVRNKPATDARLERDGVQNVSIVQADITDRKTLTAAATEISKITGGSLDVLVNNGALVSERSNFLTLPNDNLEDLDQDLRESFSTNVIGVANTIHTFLPLIRAGKEKKVVAISSGMADLDFINDFSIPIAAPYAISKAATNVLIAKYNAALGKKEGILFMSISPGLVDTSEGNQPTEQEIQGGQAMIAMFKEYAPGFDGPISASKSVEMQMEVIGTATVATYGGTFVSHYGNKQWL